MSHFVLKDFILFAANNTEVPIGDQVQQLEQTVYIVAGVLGAVCLILLIFTIYLCSTVSKLQKKLKSPTTNVTRGKTNEGADLREIETRFSQYPPVQQPQLDRQQGAPYQNPADYTSYGPAGGSSRYEQPIGSRPMGLARIPTAGQAAPQQQPRGLRNYDSYGY